jgi:hypothetical protein
MSDEIKVALMGTIVGLLSTIVPLILNWLEKRNFMTKQEKALDIAKKRIEFLNLWFDSQKAISDKKKIQEMQNEISKEFEIIKEHTTKSFLDQQTQVYIPWKQRSKVSKFFLLYVPLDFSTSILHAIYYICWSIQIFMVLACIQHGLSVNAEGSRVITYFVSLLYIFWPLIPVMIVVYFAAINREKASEVKRTQPT